MSTYKTQGIIIKRRYFGESSLILSIYTKDYGKVEVVAKSARKAKGKLKGHLELFLLSDFVFAYGKNIDRVANSFSLDNFQNIKNNLNISFGAYYILDLIDKLTENNYKNERMFYLFKDTMNFLNSLSKSDALKYCLAIIQYQINIINLSGFFPETSECTICKEDIKLEKNYFCFSNGGTIHEKCIFDNTNSFQIDNDSIRLIRLFQINKNDIIKYRNDIKNNIEIIGKLKVKRGIIIQLIGLMNNFIEYHVEKRIKSFDFLSVA